MEESEGGLTFDPERQALARRREGEALRLGLSGFALFLLLVFLTLPSGLTLRLEGWALSLTRNPWAVVALYVVVGYLTLTALALPLRVVGRRSDVRYGMSRQSWSSWALDRGKATLLGLLFALAAVGALYWTLRNFGTFWWLVFWLLSLAFTLLAGILGPVVLLPLFYRVEEIRDGGMQARLQALSRRAGVRALGVYEFRSSAKTERGAAAVAGWGRTRRILLSDHILREYAPEEVEGILAHELAHHVQRDPARFLLLSAVLSLLALWGMNRFVQATMGVFAIASLAQVANLPLFVLFGGLFYAATGPLSRSFSRWREGLADQKAAELSRNPEALARALVKLHDQNLSVADPHPWVERLFYTHPRGTRRLRNLLRLRPGMHDDSQYPKKD
ncbi:MAG: M48 family metalloprotease [Thermoplasmata archaeon]